MKNKPKIFKSNPDLHLDGLTYTLNDPDKNNHEYNYTIDLDQESWFMKDIVGKNRTAYVHM